MGLLGSEKGIGCTERADVPSDDVPDANLEPFIAISSSPAGAAPMGVGITELRAVARCHGRDPEP